MRAAKAAPCVTLFLYPEKEGSGMIHQKLLDLLVKNPVVVAVKDEEGLVKSLETDIDIVFILYGDICTIGSIVERVKAEGKTAMVHMDLIHGLSPREVSVQFIKENSRADGIITTRANLIPCAKRLNMNTILRFFLLDSMALEQVKKQRSEKLQPDVIEILPGVLQPEMIEKLVGLSPCPLMMSGLISEKKEILTALSHGAVAVSTTDRRLWDIP